MERIQPVILSGGSGTRLWPLSREQYPKQLQPLNGLDSLIQSTVLRLDAYSGARQIADAIVVSNEDYRFITAEQFRQINRSFHSIILEPAGRNTAPALTVAAKLAQEIEADPILLVMPADHLVRDAAAFCRAVEQGANLAAEGAIATFGIKPDRPETEYGYLRLGQTVAGGGAYHLASFVEKPDQETAKRYVSDAAYLWNSGIFIMRASVWLEAMACYAPEILDACQAAYRDGEKDGAFFRVAAQPFLSSPSNSIDYAVMELLALDASAIISAMVVPMQAGWSDVGAWDALWRVSDKDESDNVTSGDVLLEDVKGSLILAKSRLVACLGLEDVIIVETPDVVFVADKKRAKDVKKIVAQLKEGKRPEACAHRKQYRPWGSYDAIDCGERFQVKRIIVSPKASLSLQMHHHRAEHWVVVRGTAQVTRGDENFLVSENESAYIPLGVRHRLHNPGMLPLEMIEVQSGAYLGEDDIIRFIDTYGRVALSD
jgi:mannose-1-phosphate guanylyltransferase/mannose-6-phosphate isomerase